MFALDCRLIYSNCLAYNIHPGDENIRAICVESLQAFEEEYNQIVAGVNSRKRVPPNGHWLCHKLLERVIMHTSPGGDVQASYSFLWPIENYYSDGMLPEDYSQLVKYPMDFATISSKLQLWKYNSPTDFIRDINRTLENCNTHWAAHPREGQVYIDASSTLLGELNQGLEMCQDKFRTKPQSKPKPKPKSASKSKHLPGRASSDSVAVAVPDKPESQSAPAADIAATRLQQSTIPQLFAFASSAVRKEECPVHSNNNNRNNNKK